MDGSELRQRAANSLLSHPLGWLLGPAALKEGFAASAIQASVTDDLALAGAARQQGLRILTRRILLLPTKLGGRASARLRFQARQHQIIHIYLPGLWWAGAVMSQVSMLFWCWAALHSPAWLLVLPGAGALRWAAHEHIGRSVAQGDPARTRLIQFALAVSPLPDLLNAAMA